MKKVLGVLLIAAGIYLGLWLGLWVMFIGGIVQIVNGIKATPTNAWWIAIGIAKFLFSGIVGWLVTIIVSFFGTSLLSD